MVNPPIVSPSHSPIERYLHALHATYLALESNPEEALILSLVLVAVSFAVLVGLRDRWLGGVTASGAR